MWSYTTVCIITTHRISTYFVCLIRNTMLWLNIWIDYAQKTCHLCKYLSKNTQLRNRWSIIFWKRENSTLTNSPYCLTTAEICRRHSEMMVLGLNHRKMKHWTLRAIALWNWSILIAILIVIFPQSRFIDPNLVLNLDLESTMAIVCLFYLFVICLFLCVRLLLLFYIWLMLFDFKV